MLLSSIAQSIIEGGGGGGGGGGGAQEGVLHTSLITYLKVGMPYCYYTLVVLLASLSHCKTAQQGTGGNI